MIGGYRENMPCVVHISIARFDSRLPEEGEPLNFLVSIHVEGTGITWQHNVIVDTSTEIDLQDMTQDLYLWSCNQKLTQETARACSMKLGAKLYDTFIGIVGDKILSGLKITAVLLNIDETIQNLPWELMGKNGEHLSQTLPFGRLVTTREILRPNRDPLTEDKIVRILAVVDTTEDLISGKYELRALQALEEKKGGYQIKVDVLSGENATIAEFKRMVIPGTYDIIHFSGHGSFDRLIPETSGLRFYDGLLEADQILCMNWKSPPYFVFSSACESGRSAGGKRLISNERHSNGLAAAFIAAGVSGYAGYFWQVSDTGAGVFAQKFYKYLFEEENLGKAFLEARKRTSWDLDAVGDLAGYGAVLFGDAATNERLDLVRMGR